MSQNRTNLGQPAPIHNGRDLVRIFHDCFYQRYDTVLQGGASEPLYRPAEPNKPARIAFRHDYFASALHEVAHWCIAGERRRRLEDFGYWYEPDGRSDQQQRLFEQVEVKPQAMECIFSLCCRAPFRISTDNLQTGTSCSQNFQTAIYQQARDWLSTSLPERADQFARALAAFYRNGHYPAEQELLPVSVARSDRDTHKQSPQDILSSTSCLTTHR